MAGIVAGQPFDTLKVRMQSRPGLYASTWRCFQTTVRSEGMLALYKGMSCPLMGNGPVNAVLFASYGSTLRLLGEDTSQAHKPPAATAVAGGVAGALQCFVVAPTELLKCQLQVQTTPRGAGTGGGGGGGGGGSAPVLNGARLPSLLNPKPEVIYTGPLHCVRHRVATLGVGQGLFQGLGSTLARDVFSFGLYFSFYEWLKSHLTRLQAGGTLFSPDGAHLAAAVEHEPSMTASFVAGGLTGVLSWGAVYPVDVVKSVIQTAPPSTPREQLRMAHVARLCWQAGGARMFLRGIDSTLLRAFPVNAVTFLVY
eukprot:CAMPEP_0196771162 /NCGR_PEP_ID=MMETSP1104-20130614/1535_1 /TAXON_ID=33652 /ORGANISM="Cafeteria sp., Strain Caron Lab Isolate" /LENGTH=310 /DNA_ID=CAMNT_0042141279 /DNA_START=1 /DNA_END=930 /DNA_ORIENTATION=+